MLASGCAVNMVNPKNPKADLKADRDECYYEALKASSSIYDPKFNMISQECLRQKGWRW